jgi:transcription elongation factor S-II
MNIEFEDDDDNIREIGKSVLKTVISKQQNINLIEKYIYEKINICKLYNENFKDIYIKTIYQTIFDIKKENDLNFVLNNIKNENINWKHRFLNDFILDEIEQDNFIMNPFEIEEGVLECKCGSKRVYSYQLQSRSSDEPMTTYAQCMACKKKWTYSG